MAVVKKQENIERSPAPEEKTNEGVVNDSLGTVDPADSTGLDDKTPADKEDAHSDED